MYRFRYSSVCLCSAIGAYFLISKVIFDNIYLTSKLVVDEEFHLPLGEAYCKYEFSKWHPKVTTFPGLYLLSSIILGPLELCTVYWLRFTSLLFSSLNILLFYCLLNLNNNDTSWKNIVSALNLALLPPLYFFGHLYYTDVASLTMVLLLFLFSQRGNHYFASISGMLAVLFRQTNIIWVGLAFGCYLLKQLNATKQKKSGKIGLTPKDLHCLMNVDTVGLIKRATLNFWLNAMCYSSILLSFLVFVYVNGSIVVGDKTAHEATVHFPQILYFSLFCLFFAWPHFVGSFAKFVRLVVEHKAVSLLVLVMVFGIVHFNTLVHPYMLADNRHYVFYIWNRFYGRYVWFRYAIVPFYLFSLFAIGTKLWNRYDVSFLLLFIPCTGIVLVTQRLLEFRYFFIPYVLFRVQVRNVSSLALLCEFFSSFVLNTCVLYLFFTKTIMWAEYDDPQRLIW